MNEAARSQAGHRLVRLANGVFSIHSATYDETMHPAIGPAAEAELLYAGQLRLGERLADHGDELVVWDVGLGAAANAVAVLRATRGGGPLLRLVSFDDTLEPLRFALAHRTELGFLGGYDAILERLASDGQARFRDGAHAVDWRIHRTDFPTLLAGPLAETLPRPDAILFDPFSPARNPQMWTLDLFTNLFRRLAPERPCVLVTYSRSTMTRVALLLAGFFVGAGVASGRKEETTLAANTPALIARPLDRRWLERARRSGSAEPLAGAAYRQAPLSEPTWAQLEQHPQFCKWCRRQD